MKFFFAVGDTNNWIFYDKGGKGTQTKEKVIHEKIFLMTYQEALGVLKKIKNNQAVQLMMVYKVRKDFIIHHLFDVQQPIVHYMPIWMDGLWVVGTRINGFPGKQVSVDMYESVDEAKKAIDTCSWVFNGK